MLSFLQFVAGRMPLLGQTDSSSLTQPLFKGLEFSLVFGLLGLVIFGLAFWIMVKVLPFSVRKEIEEDQNVALAIIMGSTIMGIALILAAAITG